jgi:hypothetical protein
MNHARAVAAAISTMAWIGSAQAEPSDYVLTPLVVQGERAIELKFGDAGSRVPRESVGSVSLEYSPTGFWTTEAYLQFAHSRDQGTRYDAVEWENRFQLTEAGEYAVDWGLAVELEKPFDRAEGWKLRLGPLLQGTVGSRWQWNFNPLLANNWSGADAAATHFNYQAQFKYRYQPTFQFGLQGFGDTGRWYHWSQFNAQFHNIGPAVFGRYPLAGRRSIYYNAGWLFGYTSVTPRNTLRAQLEFEF